MPPQWSIRILPPSSEAKPCGACLQLVRVGAKVGGVGLAQVVVLRMLARQVQRAHPRRVQLLPQVQPVIQVLRL